jgi:DNA polymerase
MERITTLAELYRQVSLCQDCDLAVHRTSVVPGEGAEDADIVFVGEAPGWHEDQQGRPFVGPAGQFLDELLASINLTRKEVYIANVIKCRPPANRDPLPTEIRACQKWLDRQLELIRPRLIVSLGRYSLARFFPGQTIGKVHGKWRREGDVVYYAMYHPAAALHQQSLRQVIEADMRQIPSLLAEAEELPETGVEPQQLSMF